MENFDWTSFTRKITVKARLAVIYDAWTKASEIEKWFLSSAVFFDAGDREMIPQRSVQKGYTYAWKWYLYDETEKGTITEANGRDFLQFTFAGDCLVDIHLSELNGEVLVELTQKNIPTDENSKRNIRLGCHTGWSFFLVNLKSVYEGGLDLRNTDERCKGMGMVNS